MAILKHLIRDISGIVVPQYLKEDESNFEAVKGKNGALNVNATIAGSLANQVETLVIDATGGGIALTPAKYTTNTKAFITVETASMRYWINGSAPTMTEGHLLNAGDWLELDTADSLAKFRAIRTTEVSATIQCTYLS